MITTLHGIGPKIKLSRTRNKLTLRQFADIVEVDEQMLLQCEQNMQSIDEETLSDWANKLQKRNIDFFADEIVAEYLDEVLPNVLKDKRIR